MLNKNWKRQRVVFAFILCFIFSLSSTLMAAPPGPCSSLLESFDLKNELIVLFDGECGFCNKSMQFLLKNNQRETLKFGALQSPIGQELLARFNLNPAIFDSIVFLENDRAYTKSAAALRISRYLKWPWKAGQAFLLVPPFLRNWAYDLIAANRFRIAGKIQSCQLPTPGERKRFIDVPTEPKP